MTTHAAVKAASQARTETGEFNHKAAYALGRLGIYRSDVIGEVLGVDRRTVQRHLGTPCPADIVEMVEVQQRKEYEQSQCTGVPFRFDFVGTPEEAETWCSSGVRQEIRYHLSRGTTQSDIARLLGMSRQAVSKHVKKLRQQQVA